MARSIFGLDIGTSNIKIYCSDRDEILNEKNIIAIAHKKMFLQSETRRTKCMRRLRVQSRLLFR